MGGSYTLSKMRLQGADVLQAHLSMGSQTGSQVSSHGLGHQDAWRWLLHLLKDGHQARAVGCNLAGVASLWVQM